MITVLSVVDILLFLWVVSWFRKQAGIGMNKPENKHVAAILIAYENTVWLCLDWFDSAGSCSGPKRFEAVQAGGLSDIFPCNSNLVTLMTGKAKQTGWLLN